MLLQLNGLPHQTNAQTLLELLGELEISQTSVAVAVNGRVVRRGEHPTHRLQEGDKIEIIRAVQGG